MLINAGVFSQFMYRKNFNNSARTLILSAIEMAQKKRIELSIDCIIVTYLVYNEKYSCLYSPVHYLKEMDKKKYSLIWSKHIKEINAFNLEDSCYEFFNDLPVDGTKNDSYIMFEICKKFEKPKLYGSKRPFLLYLSNYKEIRNQIISDYYEECGDLSFNDLELDVERVSNLDNQYNEVRCQQPNEESYDSIYKDEMRISDCKDITHEAFLKKFDPIIGRDNEILRLKRILCKRFKNNPLLVGEPGVGKTHLVKALAHEFVIGNVPKSLQGYRIVSLDLVSLISGTKYRGDLEEKFKKFISNLESNKVIIFIDEIHTICKENCSDSFNVSDFFKTFLSEENFRVIGTTTCDEYRLLEKDSAIERRFDKIEVCEPTCLEAINILKNSKSGYEKAHNNIKISNEVVELCVNLSDRYIQISSLPDKAFDILDEACAMIEIERSDELVQEVLPEHVYKVITEKTGIPISNLKSDEIEHLLKLDQILKSKIIGQDNAISKIVASLKKSRLGLNNPNKPLAVFLFAGTTGVGKTQTAKVLAEEYFGDLNSLIKIDMSEYQSSSDITKLIGSPPGYVKSENGGWLTEKIKHKPYSVVLFDEIEKAHSDVLNLLLQILDEGRLTDNNGKSVNFKNTIIIMTTNIGSNVFQKSSVGFGDINKFENKSQDAISEIKNALRPELFNRIDEVIVYNNLTSTDGEKIINIYMKEFEKKLYDLGFYLICSEKVTSYVAKKCNIEQYGAREISRTFENEIVSKVADWILENRDLHEIYIDVVNNELKVIDDKVILKS